MTDIALIEKVLVKGDLKDLTPSERTSYYANVCESLDLNPLTQPFAYVTLNGKLQLYAMKNCTDQLRANQNVSINIVSREKVGEVYIVTARATLPSGRHDESTGVVALGSLKGDFLANALMKAETKAKRRVTLSICGLGLLDETEVETIPNAATHQQSPVAVHNIETKTESKIPVVEKHFEALKYDAKTQETAFCQWVSRKKKSTFEELTEREIGLVIAELEKRLPKPEVIENERSEESEAERDEAPLGDAAE